MAGIRFTKEQQLLLSQNPSVDRVSDKSITYKDEFKLLAVNKYANGKLPAEIFREAGFDLKIIGNENPGRCLERWKNSYLFQGEPGLQGEKRGCSSTGRPCTLDLSLEERLAAAEAKITYLQMENTFLKNSTN